MTSRLLRVRRGRVHRRGLSVTLVVLAALIAGTGTASLVVEMRRSSPVDTSGGGGTGTTPKGTTRPIPQAGAFVPAYDLASDPVFPTSEVGFAIERHSSGGVTTEHLAESDDGGASWYLVGAPFPFQDGYDQVQFYGLESGFAFGAAGLAVTHDGGKHWTAGGSLGGLQKVIPIGNNAWATYVTCSGPPLPTTPCAVNIAISTDDGLRWTEPSTPSPLTEAESGGDILARVTPVKAYVVSYGVTGGGLALTLDSGQSWEKLPDPCASYLVVDMAALSGGDLWMICGGTPTLGGAASAKAVFRSYDGGEHWTLMASTGFGPPESNGAPPPAGGAPVGHLPYAGQLSQLATILPNKAWIGVTGVGVLVTSDYGHNWEVAKGVGDDGQDTGVGVTFNNDVDGWAIEFHEGVWRTEDGIHWRLVDGKS